MILQGESYEFGTVFQTVAFFMFVIPRLRPGLLSLRSVLSSRQVLLLCWLVALLARCLLDVACWISLVGCCFLAILAINQTTKSQNNKTTKKTRIATFILDGAFIAQE